jgi:hypothetical protein
MHQGELSGWSSALPAGPFRAAGKNRFSLLIEHVESFLAAAGERTAVWIDNLSVCQHGSSPANRQDVEAFAAVVDVCAGGTIVVMDVENCNPASRGGEGRRTLIACVKLQRRGIAVVSFPRPYVWPYLAHV